MQLSITLASMLLTALLTLASPAPITEIEDREVIWPGSAAGYKAGRGDRSTNAELLARGLPLPRPRKLYGAARRDELAKRLPNPPPQASTGSTVYRFQGCSTQSQDTNESTAQTLTYTSLEDLANQCAALDQAGPAGSTRVFTVYDRSFAANCYTSESVNPATYIACDASNGGVYKL